MTKPEPKRWEFIERDLRTPVKTRKFFRFKDLKILAEEEWPNIPVEITRNLSMNYENWVKVVMVNKGFVTGY